jgi:hypothetical protein
MANERSSSQISNARVSILPIALYESHGLIFELYEGGQPSHCVAIRWKRLKSVTVTRENRDFTVEISERRQDLFP